MVLTMQLLPIPKPHEMTNWIPPLHEKTRSTFIFGQRVAALSKSRIFEPLVLDGFPFL